MESGKQSTARNQSEHDSPSDIDSPQLSRNLMAASKFPASMDAASSETASYSVDDDMPTPCVDNLTSRQNVSEKRPLHNDSIQSSGESVLPTASSSFSHQPPDAKRIKQTEMSAASASVVTSNRAGTSVSSSENTPVIRNEGSKKLDVPPPPKIPKPKRMARRRSSFGSDTLRVATPKRKSRPTQSSTQPHDASVTTTPTVSHPTEEQQLLPSRSSSYDEMDTPSPKANQSTSFANRTQSSSSWGTDEDYESQPKTPRAPVAAPPETSAQRQSTEGSASTSYSDLSCASSTGPTDFSRAMSPVAMYFHEGPPAPPSTPASDGAAGMNRRVIKDMGLATPLPSSASFVRNVHQLEQQHLVQQQKQQLLDDGSETPAPPRPSTHATAVPDDQKPASTTPATAASSQTQAGVIPPRVVQSNDFTEWAVGNRYQMLRMLGQGSYGQVAQALDLHQGRSDAYVAIKRIQSPFDQQVDAIRLFRELYILRRMRGNECIIQLLDVVQPPSNDLEDFHDLYLVFEYVDTDLYKLIMSPQYLSTEHIQTFLYQMLCGLKYIHSANVIHRDLKPANILLNEDCSLKICDFGLARVVDESSVMASSKQDLLDLAEKKADSRLIDISDLPLTVAQSLPESMTLGRQLTKHVVTRWYRAPELILIQPYTTAVDIWSLGCIFAELLGMQSESVPDFEDRTPLFPGGKCYPLSGDADTEERLDQLSVIFGVIGTPSKEDLRDLGEANEYVKSMGVVQPKKLENLFPAADAAALDLLRQMLKFNPKHRCTATEALGHDFFKGIRRPEMELSMERPLESPAFLHAQEIEIDVLKRKAYEEVVWFRNNVDRFSPPVEE
ncbi:protein kinase domain containing protein [Nitzschia inconspicua]|uniref:Mitogen-activated protein kinase n=1 Tax=Nitzschia inconspicua TaxID=303405 RepID=A0A9K3M171_9STRA|nr:protein kinase domain containing protein [Nitzschia inconspicua]